MLREAVLFAVASIFWYLVSEYRVWLDLDRVVYTISPGECTTLLKGGGSEDMAELDKETILVSSGINFHGKPGRIYALYTNGTLEQAHIVDSANKEFLLEGPHGISIWKDETSGFSFLYVIIHGKSKEGVAVFEIQQNPLILKYVKTIRDSAIHGIMNDLVVVDKDKFYITQSSPWRSFKIHAIELGLGLPTGGLIYYDGTSAHKILSGLAMANGIALSLDKRTLYVSEFGRKKIHVLNIRSNGNVDTESVAEIGSGPDNIQVDSKTGDLWIGSFPLMYRVIDMLNLFGPHQQVSQILRVRLSNKQVTDIEAVYVNKETEATAASTAIYKNNKLFIGTVASNLVMCDVHFLQK